MKDRERSAQVHLRFHFICFFFEEIKISFSSITIKRNQMCLKCEWTAMRWMVHTLKSHHKSPNSSHHLRCQSFSISILFIFFSWASILLGVSSSADSIRCEERRLFAKSIHLKWINSLSIFRLSHVIEEGNLSKN